MQVTVTIHEAWLARPEDLRRVMALLAGLEIPPPGAGFGLGAARLRPSRVHRGAVPPGTARPGPARSGSGRCLGAAGGGAGRGRAEGREAAPGLGLEAGARPQGDPDRLRQEAGAALEDRGVVLAGSGGRVPVRPPAASDDPLTGPYPPMPRAEAFARSAWEWCRRKHLNQWTAGQRRIFNRIWLEEVTVAARARKDRS